MQHDAQCIEMLSASISRCQVQRYRNMKSIFSSGGPRSSGQTSVDGFAWLLLVRVGLLDVDGTATALVSGYRAAWTLQVQSRGSDRGRLARAPRFFQIYPWVCQFIVSAEPRLPLSRTPAPTSGSTCSQGGIGRTVGAGCWSATGNYELFRAG